MNINPPSEPLLEHMGDSYLRMPKDFAVISDHPMLPKTFAYVDNSFRKLGGQLDSVFDNIKSFEHLACARAGFSVADLYKEPSQNQVSHSNPFPNSHPPLAEQEEQVDDAEDEFIEED